MDKEIKKYISRRKAEGGKKEVIIKELVKNGWSLEQATRAFVVNRIPAHEVNIKRQKIIAILILSAILILIGGIAIYWLINNTKDNLVDVNSNTSDDSISVFNTNASGFEAGGAMGIQGEVVAVVDGTLIMDERFQKEVTTLISFYSKQTSGTTIPSRDIIEKTVLSTLIKKVFMEDRAISLDLGVTEAEIDDEYAVFVEESGGEYAALDQLQSLFSWSVEKFKTQVLKPYLIRQKLEVLLSSDHAIKSIAQNKVETVLQKLESGEQSFESLADEYSEDTGASAGGDIGFIEKGETIQEFEDAAFSLAKNEISGIVETVHGHHIIKVLEITKNDDDEIEQIQVAHIFIKIVDIDKWIIDQLALKSVVLAVGGYEWKSECGLALDLSETCESNNLTSYVPDELVEADLNATAPISE